MGRPKGQVERSLLSARARLEGLIDRDEISESVRAQLMEISNTIRSVELQIGNSRLKSQWLNEDGSDILEKNMLVQLYTDLDFGAAEGNQVISGIQPHDILRRCSLQEHGVMQPPAVTDMLQKVGTLHFDAVAFSEAASMPLLVTLAHIVEQDRLIAQVRDLGQINSASTFQVRIASFTEKISQLYKTTNSFHSAKHAADVVATQAWYFKMPYMKANTSPLDNMMSLIAGAVHDVGHPGTTNAFHAKTMSSLAIRYNDKSILENMSVSLSFEVLRSDSSYDWFSLLPKDFRAPNDQEAPLVNLQQYVRKGLVHMVLSTDMAKHAKLVADLNTFVDALDVTAESTNAHQEKHTALEQKLLTLASVLHASDISNPAKPRPIMLKWVQRVCSEFWAQGDEETRLGLPVSPLCNRATEKDAIPTGQLGFISYVLMPLMKPIVQLLPEAQQQVDILLENKSWWEEREKAKATQEDIWKLIE